MSVIGNIFIYYSIFIIASFFFMKADTASSNKRVKLFLALGVIILSIFASLRGSTVGWDTYDTVHLNFDRLKYYNSFSSLWSNRDAIKEPVYWLISYTIRSVTDDSRIFLFVLQLLTVGPVAIVAYENRKKYSITIMMVVYMLLFYQVSLNIIRQSISAAFLLLTFSKLLNKSYFKAGISGVAACFMHNSGIIGLFLILTIYIMTGNRNSNMHKVIVVMLAFVGVTLLFFWENIFNYLIDANILNGNYNDYVSIMSGDVSSKYTVFSIRNIVFEFIRVLGTVIIFYGLRGHHTESDREIRFLKYSSIVSLIMYSIINLVMKSYLGDRLCQYLDYMQLFTFSIYHPKHIAIRVKLSKNSITIHQSAVKYCFVYCFGFNLIVYMAYNYGHTIPYELA